MIHSVKDFFTVDYAHYIMKTDSNLIVTPTVDSC